MPVKAEVAAPFFIVLVRAPRHTDASEREIEARVHVARKVCTVHVLPIGRAVKVRQAIGIGTESIGEILRAEIEIVAVSIKVAFREGAVEAVVEVELVGRVGRGELNGEN